MSGGFAYGILCLIFFFICLYLHLRQIDREVEREELQGKERLGFTAEERREQSRLYPGSVDRRGL